MPKPLKRHESLQPVSREHHHGLLLSFKIREGLKKKVDVERMKRYADWFWTNHLFPHFEYEEKFILPILDKEDKLVKRTIREHRRLKRLFLSSDNVEHNIMLIEEELVAHIRFEERILFQEIQKIATLEQLKMIEEAHVFIEDKGWEDEFWLD